MSRDEWDRIERQVANGRVVEFFDAIRAEFLLVFRWNRRFLVQTEDGYTLKSAFNLKDIGQYLTSTNRRRY